MDLVARCQFRRVGPAVQGLHAHPFHAVGDKQTARNKAVLAQKKPFQHPAACERIVHVQLVNSAYQLGLGFADWALRIIQAAPADPEQISLVERSF